MSNHSRGRWRFWKALPSWIIVTIGVLLLTTIIVFSVWRIFSFEGSVNVSESIGTNDSLTFTVEMFPNETKVVSRTIQNIGPADVRVDLGFSLTPLGRGVSAQLSATTFIVSAGGTKTFRVTISAANDAQPGTYQVVIDVFRSAGAPESDSHDDDD